MTRDTAVAVHSPPRLMRTLASFKRAEKRDELLRDRIRRIERIEAENYKIGDKTELNKIA